MSEWRNYLFEHEDDIDAAAGILLFNDQNEVLLSKRSSSVNNPLTIGTIGGHLTTGETPVEGAKREFYEEAGYKGPFDDIKLLTKQVRDDGFRYYSFIARTDTDKQDFEPLDDFQHEITWNKWIPLNKAIKLNNLHPGLEEIFSDSNIVSKIKQYLERNANKD